ncbi:MAG: pyruvate dehydrogenase (acetyl-transferring) E1 component subunit alpha [Phycisphaeraceae bacterium]|nr:pyruvate dehydrogenase (acetyl-transferring) E1 component subunit alpha [Phycisphaeraceae bacterium]
MTTATGQNTQTQAKTDGGYPDAATQLDAVRLKQYLGRMMLIRRFEERTMQSYMQGKIGGFCHIYIGQEAVAVGSIAATRPDDPIITAYRDHGHALARDMDPRHCMAEMFGKITGCAKGKGGSMHLFDKPNHMYGGHAIVGGQCPLGVGLAWGIHYLKEPKVCLCYLGDGALNQGAFHESMNLAAIWNLPIIFVVENNMYSMGTSIERGTSMAHDLSVKAKAYGIRYAECDGLDFRAVYNCFKHEVDRTRPTEGDQESGDGPAFINVVTYRYQGHSMSDPQKYRTREEVQQKQADDPITRMAEWLIDDGHATQEEIDELDQQAKEQAIASVRYAEESDEPELDELYTDVFSEPFEPYKTGEPPLMMREAEDQ